MGVRRAAQLFPVRLREAMLPHRWFSQRKVHNHPKKFAADSLTSLPGCYKPLATDPVG
jgi:hypothetical protein